MGRSGEIPNDVKEQIIFHHKSGKGYKSISKITGVHKSTVRAIIRKWKAIGTVVNLPRSGRPAKISPSVEEKLILEVTQNPSITMKELQASLALAKVKVHGATIRKTLRILGFERVTETDQLCVKEEMESCDSEDENDQICRKEVMEPCDPELEMDKLHKKDLCDPVENDLKKEEEKEEISL